MPVTQYRSSPSTTGIAANLPTVILIHDPAELFPIPETVVQELHQRGLSVISFRPPWSTLETICASNSPAQLKDLSVRHLLEQLVQQEKLEKSRLGLVGIGLAGDLVLTSVTSGMRIAATLAISPLSTLDSLLNTTEWGLEWLRELSYRQAWRWRRQRAALRRAVVALKGMDKTPSKTCNELSIAIMVHTETSPKTIATRIEDRQFDVLSAPSPQKFRLLQDTRTRLLLLDWLEDQLAPSSTSLPRPKREDFLEDHA
jgi:dienelactone hydrolase